ncbi:MAG: Holliday junction resolvase RuvX [Xanthomonadales bacterium]|nr:Holliday junction resolvase RuvX [Gammaproteobacteria bacterium]MBT8051324.1 Holliday junction resolvase RuvX [Gammaproteobacteria bacterium]NNJ77774.1 Holliday junction resolvase RuvX [Xanthomonadales bacterium]NNL04687.1 Holliday junction resolvase RuvX [Xanthomonadales bacterium]
MPEAAPVSGYILTFDFGLRRIGVAIGQTLTGTATALETIGHGKAPDWAAIDRLVADWKPALLLVGLPLGLEGEETEMSTAARHFGTALEKRFGMPVAYVDERLSSRVAGERFAERRAAGTARRKDARQVDAMAAQVICENWLRQQDA